MDEFELMRREKKSSIVVVGSANFDLIAYTPTTLPSAGQTILGNQFKTFPGGKGANQAVAAARLCLGSDSQTNVHMICKVGNDAYGEQLLMNFDKDGVKYEDAYMRQENTKSAIDSLHTGIASITVDRKGENTIVVIPGSNHALTSDEVERKIRTIVKQNLDTKPIIMTQLEIQHDVALAAMKVGKELGALTILNPAPVNDGSLIHEDFYKFVDIIIPNETELKSLVSGVDQSEEGMAKELLNRGIGKAVIVTLGGKGACVVERIDGEDCPRVTLISAPESVKIKQDDVIDTVGAGDSFCGSFAVYLSAGLDIPNAATNACGVAGLSVCKTGAQSSYPTIDQLPECLRSHLDLYRKEENMLPKKSPTLTFVTGNKNKLEEVKKILSTDSMNLSFHLTNKKIDLPELQGDPIEIAQEKCRLAAREIEGPVFIEDTSLCFNALNGLPGPYIKWFLESCGHNGLNKMLNGFEDRSAYAQTIVAYTTGVGNNIHVFEGRTTGKIVEARGPTDFGWDPIFEPDEGNGMTYAEMEKIEKNAISHRGKSFDKFRSFLTSKGFEQEI